jgi:hypothetical protein
MTMDLVLPHQDSPYCTIHKRERVCKGTLFSNDSHCQGNKDFRSLETEYDELELISNPGSDLK